MREIGKESDTVQGEEEKEKRRVFTFQISRLTRTHVSFSFFGRGISSFPTDLLYVFIIGTRLVMPLETCVPAGRVLVSVINQRQIAQPSENS